MKLKCMVFVLCRKWWWVLRLMLVSFCDVVDIVSMGDSYLKLLVW